MMAAAALLTLIVSVVASPRPAAPLAAFARDATTQAPLRFPVPDNNTRVPIVLGVMSRCPDAFLCESLFTDALQQTWDIVDINLSFIGTINASDAAYGVTCKHGPEECAGNVQELCAINRAHSQEDWWQFLQCVNYEGLSGVGDEELAKRCAGITSIPWEDENSDGSVRKGIKSCVNGKEGKSLLKKSVKQTKAMGITKSCTIVISGKQRCVRDGTWKDCETGHTVEELVSYIQDEYERLQDKSTSTSNDE